MGGEARRHTRDREPRAQQGVRGVQVLEQQPLVALERADLLIAR
jgi:hypothetical protein